MHTLNFALAITRLACSVIAEYVYDGLGQRIGWHYDVNASGGGPDASDPWYWFIYDDRWRIVSTFRVAGGSGTGAASFRHSSAATDTYAKERFVHHAAGLDGLGGSSYIDSVLMTDRDLSTSWGSAADTTAETRLYYGQNWRADTSVVVSSTGAILRWYKYTAYGKRTEIDAGDFNRDGFVDGFDYDDFMACYEDNICPAGRTADVTFDGGQPDGFDYDAFMEAYDTSPEHEGGNVRNLYAGYESDPTLEATAIADSTGMPLIPDTIYHVRNRVYSTELGRWTRRDPIGYLDVQYSNLYEYVKGGPVVETDCVGLWGVTWNWWKWRDVSRWTYWFLFWFREAKAPANSRSDCGISVMQNPENGGHRWIRIDLGDGGPIHGCGYWSGSLWTTDHPDGFGKGQYPCGPNRRFWPNIVTTPGRIGMPLGDPREIDGGGCKQDQTPTCYPVHRVDALNMGGEASAPMYLGFGYGQGRKCSDATCLEIRDCIRKFVPSRGYTLLWYNCRDAADEALSKCCLDYGKHNHRIKVSP